MRNLFGLAMLAGLLTASAAHAQISDGVVKIGVLTDQSGNFSALSGAGSVAAAEMAAADFGGSVAGKPIVVINADHQNKTDVGLAIARRWYEADGVQMIVDVPNSAIMLGVQEIARERNRVLIVSGGGTADFTNKACSPRTTAAPPLTKQTPTTTTSPLIVDVKGGGDTLDFLLQ